VLLVEGAELVEERRLTDAIRPRDTERHLRRWMNTALGESPEREDIAAAEPEFEARCPEGQLREWREVCHTSLRFLLHEEILIANIAIAYSY